jgi:undecaprenyl diphosphate synthase
MPETLPEVIGWNVAEAKEKLAAAGWQVEIKETAAPARAKSDSSPSVIQPESTGDLRVIRTRIVSEHTVELVAAMQSHLSSVQAESESTTAPASAAGTAAEGTAQSPEDVLLARIDMSRVPQHIAIVMDGNGRWAEKRGLPRVMGHRAGHDSVTAIVDAAPDFGIKYLTLYTFSAENWKRPAPEVAALMELIPAVLHYELPHLKEEGVKVRPLGRVEGLPQHVQDEFRHAYEETQHNTRLTLNIAVNYSGRWEIIDAVRKLAQAVKEGRLDPDAIDEDLFASQLYLPDMPDPELLIRTSGEHRISNYLLWQIAYTEVYVTPVLWPDFRGIHLMEAILDYQQRHRRFGALAPDTEGADRGS